MAAYTFTQNWFYNSDLYVALTSGFLDPSKPWRVLEIGCFEGSATTFISDTILDHPESRMTCVDPFDETNNTTTHEKGGNYTKDVFLENIEKSKNHSKIELVETYSSQFYEKNEKTFNFIYIDGSHLVEDVALDFQKCLDILEPDGIMWMDDYLWGDGVSIRDCIDKLYEDNKYILDIVHKSYQIGFRKKTNMFHPWNVGLEKVRIGNLDGDGGYVVLDSNFGSKYILGYGVDRDVSFENELTEKYGMKGFVFDHTIQEVPNVSSNVTYLPEGIGSSVAPPLFTLENHVSRFVPDGESFILKMDVEGCEWDVLRTADLSRVTQLIIEFHDLQAAPLEVVSKLNETFYLAHIHGNNCHNQPWVQIDRVHKMPRYLECTYVRKDLVSGATLDLDDFPVPQDIKCRPDAPELELDFWKPCTDPVIFVAPDANQVNILERLVTKEDRIVSRIEDAEGPLVFVLEKNDIVPVNVIMSLDNIRKQGSVQFPVLKNGYMESYEVRFINKLVPTLLRCPEPIINLKKFLL